MAFAGNRLAIDNGYGSSDEFAVTVVDLTSPACLVLLATAIDGLSVADFLWQPTGIAIADTSGLCLPRSPLATRVSPAMSLRQ